MKKRTVSKTNVKSKSSRKRGIGRKSSKGRKIKKTSRLRKPDDMPLEQWQIALRKKFGQEQDFRLKNIGDEPIFSEFIVENPQTQIEYRVEIRGQRIGDNYCSCPDFAVNNLGTCKHIEFTLAKLQRKRGGKKTLAEGFKKATDDKLLKSTERVNVVINLADDITYEEVAELLRALNGLHSSLAGFAPYLNEIQIGQHTDEYEYNASWRED